MSLLGAIGGVVSSVVDGVTGIIGHNSANAKAKRQANISFMREKQLIDEANEYNKPVNQMSRLEEAGLNPNLVYENGAQTLSANVGAPPEAKTFGPEVTKFNMLQNILALENMERQEEKTQAEINAIENSVSVQNQNLELAREAMGLRKRAMDLTERMTDARINEIMNRQGDPTLDFLGGLMSGVFGNEPVPEIGSNEVRPAFALSANLGRLGKDFAVAVKKYGFKQALDIYSQALGR